jgi:hypothetical protein
VRRAVEADGWHGRASAPIHAAMPANFTFSGEHSLAEPRTGKPIAFSLCVHHKPFFLPACLIRRDCHAVGQDSSRCSSLSASRRKNASWT